MAGGKGDASVPRIALVGTPNVGKSTLFNALTGANQHTGNWAGKTVELARGSCRLGENRVELIDLPGTYSLYSHSPEEAVTRDYVMSGEADLYMVVLDSSCPERSINLGLQVIDVCPRVLLCFNLADEAERAGVQVDIEKASALMGAPAVSVSARHRPSLHRLKSKLVLMLEGKLASDEPKKTAHSIDEAGTCADELDLLLNDYIEKIAGAIGNEGRKGSFLGAMLLSSEDGGVLHSLNLDGGRVAKIRTILDGFCKELLTSGADRRAVQIRLSERAAARADAICNESVRRRAKGRPRRDAILDRILTGKYTAYPIMLLILFLVLYITIELAAYPSRWLSELFGFAGEYIKGAMLWIEAPEWLSGLLYDGIYTVLTAIVAVMLPPMAIFFPLFTLLEDMGLLPRFAYNLDSPFRCVGGCGKQSLTMCMGLGCNAVGVTGCRIIDSPRERRLAIVTNSLMPCNGRFPTIILALGLFLPVGGALGSVLGAILLLAVILVGVGATFLLTFILSRTVYRGRASFFTVEMPSFRRPDTLRVITRSFLDRTLRVLWRAVLIAIPSGAVIWLLTYISVGDGSLLSLVTGMLDPIGLALGLDGVLICAFILGTPASEIVLPLALVGYAGIGVGEAMAVADVGRVLIDAGWTVCTVVCTVIFSLMHWPCATTLSTVYKETGSFATTLLSALAPTVLGCTLCIILRLILVGV